jgi:hypothetical protein
VNAHLRNLQGQFDEAKTNHEEEGGGHDQRSQKMHFAPSAQTPRWLTADRRMMIIAILRRILQSRLKDIALS